MTTARHRVLLTGGAGFIGAHLARQLVEAGHEVRALDLLNEQVHAHPDAAVARFPGDVLTGDVRDADAVARALEGCDAVVHLAAETGVGQSMYEVDRYRTVNVDGTEVVATAAARAGAPLVAFSSRAVYGGGAYECPEHGRTFGTPGCSEAVPSPSREDDAFAPVSVYGETKVDGERILERLRAEGAAAISVRPQNVIGPGQALHNPYTGVLAAFASRLGQGLAPQIYGDGLQTRDFVDVTDVAAAVVHLLGDPARWAVPAVNVGSGERTTLLQLAQTCADTVGLDAPMVHVDVTRPGDIEHACADLTVADAVGLPRAAVTLAQSVGRFLDYAAGEDDVDPTIWDRALTELDERAKGSP